MRVLQRSPCTGNGLILTQPGPCIDRLTWVFPPQQRPFQSFTEAERFSNGQQNRDGSGSSVPASCTAGCTPPPWLRPCAVGKATLDSLLPGCMPGTPGAGSSSQGAGGAAAPDRHIGGPVVLRAEVPVMLDGPAIGRTSRAWLPSMRDPATRSGAHLTVRPVRPRLPPAK